MSEPLRLNEFPLQLSPAGGRPQLARFTFDHRRPDVRLLRRCHLHFMVEHTYNSFLLDSLCEFAKLWRATTGGPPYPRVIRSKTYGGYVKPWIIPKAIYRVSQKEWTKLRESVPYVKLYRYNPKHLYPKLNGYGDNGHRKVWASGVSTYCSPSVTPYSSTAHVRQRASTS